MYSDNIIVFFKIMWCFFYQFIFVISTLFIVLFCTIFPLHRWYVILMDRYVYASCQATDILPFGVLVRVRDIIIQGIQADHYVRLMVVCSSLSTPLNVTLCRFDHITTSEKNKSGQWPIFLKIFPHKATRTAHSRFSIVCSTVYYGELQIPTSGMSGIQTQ